MSGIVRALVVVVGPQRYLPMDIVTSPHIVLVLSYIIPPVVGFIVQVHH